MTFPAHEPDTPAGSPLNEAPLAPVVAYEMSVIGLFTQTVWWSVPAADVSIIVLFGVTLMVPVVDTILQPPVKVTV